MSYQDSLRSLAAPDDLSQAQIVACLGDIEHKFDALERLVIARDPGASIPAKFVCIGQLRQDVAAKARPYNPYLVKRLKHSSAAFQLGIYAMQFMLDRNAVNTEDMKVAVRQLRELDHRNNDFTFYKLFDDPLCNPVQDEFMLALRGYVDDVTTAIIGDIESRGLGHILGVTTASARRKPKSF